MKQIILIFIFVIFLFPPIVAADIDKPSSRILISNEIEFFKDPFSANQWNEKDIRGSVVFCWRDKPQTIQDVFIDFLIFTPHLDGGLFKISLMYPTFSSLSEITGVWKITSNVGGAVRYERGTLWGIDNIWGQSIRLMISDEIILNAQISFMAIMPIYLAEINGQIKNGDQDVNAMVTLTQKNLDEDTLATYQEGHFKFLMKSMEYFKSLRIQFFTTEFSEFSGHIYIGGMPWENAEVVLIIDSIVLSRKKTDYDGFFRFDFGDITVSDFKNEDVEINLLLTPE